MTDNNAFERFVADHLADDGSGAAQAERIAALTDERASEQRQWPRWLALIKEPPMRTNSHLTVGSPAARVAAIMVATISLAAALVGASFAGSQLFGADRSIVVDQAGGGDYTTIGEAVAAADDGDEILVKAGTYAESVTIDKDITLRGEDRDGVVVEFGHGCTVTADQQVECPDGTPAHEGSGSAAYALLLDEADAELSDLTVRSAGEAGGGLIVIGGAPAISGIALDGEHDPWASVLITDGSEATISESDLGEVGIVVHYRSPATVRGNDAKFIWAHADTPVKDHGLSTIVGNRVLWFISVGGSALVEGNVVSFPDDADGDLEAGIDVQVGDGWEIRGNTVSGFPTGIFVNGRLSGTIAGNTLEGNQLGIGAGTGPDTVVEGNTVRGGAAGISMPGGARLADNVVEGASFRGIAISGDTPLVVTGNRSCDNGDDLWVADGATPTIDDSNEFCDDDPAG